MKKKVMMLTIASTVLLSGVVSAASMWGTYNGRDVVRLTIEGVPVKVTDAPAINFENRTMVPIYLLEQAGIKYSWDNQNKTVDIKKPLPEKEVTVTETILNDVLSIARELSRHGVTDVALSNDAKRTTLVYEYNKSGSELEKDVNGFGSLLTTSVKTTADDLLVKCNDGAEFTVEVRYVRDYLDGKITADKLADQYNMTGGKSAPAPAPVTTPSTSAPSTTPSTQPDVSTPPPAPVNNACQDIIDRHVLEDQSFDRNNSPFDGSTNYLRDQKNSRQDSELSAAGC